MMAAAQAAAEAALREASARESRVGGHQTGTVGAPLPNQAIAFAGYDNIQHQQQQQHGQRQQLHQQQIPLHGIGVGMGFPVFGAFQTEEFHARHEGNVFQTEVPIVGEDATVNSYVQLLAQQRQQQNHQRLAGSLLHVVPQQHYLTIAQNGTILEATQTITGFPPDALLMTSAYDTIYDEDLPAFLCVKTQFWDKGQPDVEVFLRRRSMNGEWLWIVCKVVSYVERPVAGFVLEEAIVRDEGYAKRLNRISRITAILVQAVEASQLEKIPPSVPESRSVHGHTMQSSILNDAVAYRSLLESMNTSGVQAPENAEVLENLMQIAAGDGVSKSGSVMDSVKEQESWGTLTKKKTFDPLSMIDSVRQGVRLDLGLSVLIPEEVRMITLVLAGKVPIHHVVPSVLMALRLGKGLKEAFMGYSLDSEKVSTRHSVSGASLENSTSRRNSSNFSFPSPSAKVTPPPIFVINFSCTYIGNAGIEILSEILFQEGSQLKTIDVSFCNIEEKGLIALARALSKRKRRSIPCLKGLILSGNYMSSRAATELGIALSPAAQGTDRKRSRTLSAIGKSGYDTESEDEDDEDEDLRSTGRKRLLPFKRAEINVRDRDHGLQVLHVANASMTAKATGCLLTGLGPLCPIRELNLSSNNFGPSGASVLAQFLEVKQRSKGQAAMPFLDRLDMSNNNLGDDGTTQLTRAVSMRSNIHLVDLKLSSNAIAAGGIETIMNKLLQHNLLSLSLDKNSIGDQGCQLVAASLQSMKALSRLNLGFNQIGSRGINSLMRSLVGCESITYLGLSGNILQISGAIALAFMLSQHPRLEELDLDNCCLGQAAQCHIVAGAISNRWVPMKRLKGYATGPPMVAIGALKPYAQNFSNEECFRIRKDEQMKTILQWRETNRIAKKIGNAAGVTATAVADSSSGSTDHLFLSPDFVANINDVHGTPSQNAYFRLLGWLSRIPFDDDELTSLQKYFYDPDGGEGDRGNDGYVNLKLRGDLLAALDSEVADEIRDEFPSLASELKESVGIDLDKLKDSREWLPCNFFKEKKFDERTGEDGSNDGPNNSSSEQDISAHLSRAPESGGSFVVPSRALSTSKPAISHSESTSSASGRDKKINKVKPRITMFPQFEQQLEELKATASDMIEQEDDPMQHEVILTQYAEASLTILRQLRYYCMNSGLDGWRQGGMKRKILVVDDSNVTRKLVSRAFEKANFIVDTASNGAEGVEKLKASIYDIAFMDIDMPVMNGFEATKKLREWEDTMRPGCRQPICALTATYVDDFERSELMKFREAGLDVMESKPCNMPRLFKVVDDVSPMFSDLSIGVIQREQSDSSLGSSTKK
jgi:CheY-like chemotaxis protein